jgi:hypothetical protein
VLFNVVNTVQAQFLLNWGVWPQLAIFCLVPPIQVALKITIMRLKMPFLHGRPFVVYGISFVSANQNDGTWQIEKRVFTSQFGKNVPKLAKLGSFRRL